MKMLKILVLGVVLVCLGCAVVLAGLYFTFCGGNFHPHGMC